LGTDYPYSEFLPDKGSVIQVDERAGALGRRAPTALGVIGSVRPTVKLLLDEVAAKTNGGFFDREVSEECLWDAETLMDEAAQSNALPIHLEMVSTRHHGPARNDTRV